MTKQYCNIMFMHGYEDDSGNVEKFLDNFEITEAQLIEYLAQWDMGGESEHSESLSDETPWGKADSTFVQGDYVLSWNTGMDYVSLTRIIEDKEEESEDPTPPTPEPVTLTLWEAEQLANMLRHCKDIDDIMGAEDSDSHQAKLDDLLEKLDQSAIVTGI